MTYQDILEVAGIGARPATGTLATRTVADNPNHHLWNNRGTWWCHFTLHRDDYTAERVRVSLETRDLGEARSRRDHLLETVSGRRA
ncbi:MAG: hypothetical protein WD342_14135 [Verrucomicrobiales bacterium]